MTNGGASLWSTVSPPSTTSAKMPATRPEASTTRSRRRGRRLMAARTTSTMATVMATLTRRLPNSTQAWNWSGATTLVEVHAGQSLQPRPEPVSRTAPPLTMATASATTEIAALRLAEPGASSGRPGPPQGLRHRVHQRRC